MTIVRRFLSNFTKGEASPLMESRSDIDYYFEMCSRLVNFNVLRQGGASKRVGTIFVKEVKTSSLDTILIPFIRSDTEAYIIEAGNLYFRFIKNRAQIPISSGSPTAFEIVSPYSTSQLRDIHFTQSVDVMYLAHQSIAPQKLVSLGDTSWTINPITFTSPATFEADIDISGGTATLTPGATTGTGVTFTASSSVFLAGDVGRTIIFGASRALITAQAGTTATATIIDAFPDTNPIPAGSWFLRGAPQVSFTNAAQLVGIISAFTMGGASMRAADVGRYILAAGGMFKILRVDSTTTGLTEVIAAPDWPDDAGAFVAAAGTWTLETVAWSATYGYPRTVEFIQGRLGWAATTTLPTTWWLSRSDDYESYGRGITADSGIAYLMAAKRLVTIQWLADNADMFVATSGSVHRALGGKDGEPLGGDVIPNVKQFSNEGSMHVQPVVLSQDIFFLDKLRRKLFLLGFNFERDNFDATEVTALAEHIFGNGARLGHIAFTLRPDPRLYIITDNGTLVTLTYLRQDKVVGFSRYTTPGGAFESVAVIPGVTGWDEVYVVVKRVINGVTKRYIEYFDLRDISG